MKTYPLCLPCISGLLESTVQLIDLPEDQKQDFMAESRLALARADTSLPPACIAGESYLNMLSRSGQNDLYRAHKQNSIQEALKLYPRLKKLVEAAPDSLEAALRVSALGNILDIANPNGYDLEVELGRLFSAPLRGQGLEKFRTLVKNARGLLILADNAGETVFDRVLIEALEIPVAYAVKSGPAFDDALLKDALAAGLGEIAEVIPSGSPYPGTYLPACSPEFLQRFKAAPLVLAKGQANYETLSDASRELFFLLKVKCEVVSREIDHPLGSLVLEHHPGQDLQGSSFSI